ncbi:MAG: alkaline phosphatase, partial [Actinobacteria bacterium]|nr:alkaline phosphatase [Actinomycetota bacterium]
MSTVAGVALGATPAVAASAETAETPVPKNVIVLISDGGGYNQFDAARLYETGASYQQVEVAPNSGTATKVPGTKSEVYDDFAVQIAQSHYSAGGRAAYD